MPSTQLIDNWQSVLRQITTMAQRYARNPSDIHLLAVSKFHSIDAIATLAKAGQVAFGENYVQEMLYKATALTESTIAWHFIGPLQSNKCKEVAMTATMIHSVDRLKLVTRLAQYRPTSLPPLKVLLQVNIDDETSKSGVTDYDTLVTLAQAVLNEERLQLCGLMTIPAPRTDMNAQRQSFAQLRQMRDQLAQQLDTPLPELSMGMSADLEAAIAEGATIVRIGTAIFGHRNTTHSLHGE